MELNNGARALPSTGEGSVPVWQGLYPATVANNVDPLGQGRLQLRVPMVTGPSVTTWATALAPYSQIPEINTQVGVFFLGGDVQYPVWVWNEQTLIPGGNNGAVFFGPTPPPSPVVGDAWIQTYTNAGSTVYGPIQEWVFNAGAGIFEWVQQAILDGNEVATGTIPVGALTPDLQATINGKTTVSYGASLPPTGRLGDVWIQTNGTNITQILECTTAYTTAPNITYWTVESALNARQYGAPFVYAQGTAPVSSSGGPLIGDLWINTSSGNAFYQMTSGTSSSPVWTPYQWGTNAIANGAITVTQLAGSVNARALGGVTTTLATTAPVSGNVTGDLWINSTTGQISQYNGTSFVPVTFTGSSVIQAGTITGATIAAATITGANIQAGTITAKNLNVGDSLNPNPYFGGGDISSWTAFATSGTVPGFTGVATTGGFGYPWAGRVAAVAGSAFPGISSTNFAVNAGDPVQVNGWFNTNAALQFTISYFNSGGSFIGQTVTAVPASAGNWQYGAIAGTVVAGGVTANLTIKVNTGSAAGTEVFQATGLTVITKLNGGIIEAGTVTALQIAAQTITADQLAVTGNNTGTINPYFSGGSTAAWGAFNGSISAVQPGGSAFYPWAAKFTPSGSNNTGGINGFGAGITGTIVQCAPGNGVNFFAKVFATQTNMSLQMQWYTSAFGFISQTSLSTPVTVSTWTDVSWIAIPPATAAFGIPIIQMQAASGNLSATTDFFYASGVNVLTSIDGGIINAGTINTAQLNAAAINGMTITGNTINGASIWTNNMLENVNGAFFYGSTPQPPALTTSTTGGTLPALTYYTKIAYVNSSGTSIASNTSAIVTTGTTSTVTVTAPGTTGNATGYNVYMTNTNGGTAWLQNTTPIALGTNYVRSTPLLTSGTAAPTVATGIVNIAASGLLAVTVAVAGLATDGFGNQTLPGLASYAMNFVSNPQLAVSLTGSVIQFYTSATLGGIWTARGQIFGASDGSISLVPGSGTAGGIVIGAGSTNNNALAFANNTGTPTASVYGSQIWSDINQFLRYHNNTDSQNYSLGQKFTQVINGSVATGGGYSTLATLTVGTLGTYRIQGVLAYSQATSPSGSPRIRFDQGTATQGHATGRFSSAGVPVVIDASPLTSSNTFAGGTISSTEQILDFDYVVPITAGGTILIAGASTGSAYTVNFLNVTVTPL